MTRKVGGAWPVIAAALLCCGFLALGTWQIQRMGWKHALIARIEARVQSTPVAVPARTEWPAVETDPERFEYRRVRLQGQFLHAQQALVQATTTLGAGFWVLTPLQLADGSQVFINRGFVSPAQRQAVHQPGGTVQVDGLLRLSQPGGGFLRQNDAQADRWHSRDIRALAQSRKLSAAAPYFVDADASGVEGQSPIGGLTVLRFTDHHLVYALTWYGLALMVIGAGWLVRREQKRRRSGDNRVDAQVD